MSGTILPASFITGTSTEISTGVDEAAEYTEADIQ
jgi:hypothetical protein